MTDSITSSTAPAVAPTSQQDATTSADKPKLTISRVDNPDGTHFYRTSDGKTFSIDELMFYVESKIAKYFQDRLQQKNDKLKQQITDHSKLTDLLTEMQSKRPSGEAHIPADVAQWMGENGLDVKSGQLNKGDWDSVTETLKSKLDSMNSTNQTDTIETENLTKMLDEVNEFLANVENVLAKTVSTIISNLRAG